MNTKQKQVGIVTLFSANYGNKLQNYAVYYTMKTLGYTPITILPKQKNSFAKRWIKRVLYYCRSIIPSRYYPLAQAGMFDLFAKKWIPMQYENAENNLFTKDVGEKYDFFVVGSDQVWNSFFEYARNQWGNYLLEFAPPEKRHSFSPSMGIDIIAEDKKDLFSKEVSQFVNLCAREETVTQLLKEHTGREDVFTTIDPVLMLDEKQWMHIAEKVKGCPTNFVLEYFLGDIPEYNEAVLPKNVERIQLLNINNKKWFFTTPAQFIWLVSKSEIVRTDSFHACVFSILFSKPLVVYYRKDKARNMFSRMETLFSMFGIDIHQHIGIPVLVDSTIRDRVLREKREELIKALRIP